MKRNPKKIVEIVAAVLAAGLLVFLFLPAAHYTYEGVVYDINGLELITGKTVCGGSVHIPSMAGMLCYAMVSGLLLAWSIVSLVVKKISARAACIASAVLTAVVACVLIAWSMKVETVLSGAGAKQVGVHVTYLVPLAMAAVGLMLQFIRLHLDGGMDIAADLAGNAALLALSLAVPFGTYTYKKTSHPFTGFDFLLGKEVAKETVTEGSIYPALLLVLAAAVLLAVLLPKLSKKLRAVLTCCLSLAAAIVLVVITVSVRATVMDIKDGKVGPGLVVPMLAAIAMFARSIVVLYQEKAVTPLDFMLLPGLAYLLINNYLPMIGISFAFKKMDYSVGVWKSPWVGFENFKYLFSTKTAWIITRNTLLYNFSFIVVSITIGIIAGICLAALTKKLVRTIYQTSILLPQLISMIIVAYIVFAFLSNEAGFINKTVLGAGNEINFYGDTKWWPFLLVFIYNWKQIGYNAVIFLSSIVGIDKGLYEAAMVDGCTPWQQITKITLPQLKPTIITLTLLQVGRVFYSDFGLFYQVPMDSGALYNVTNTIDTYVYRSMMVLNNISSASAANAFQSVCGFLLVFTVNMIVRKVDNENALF